VFPACRHPSRVGDFCIHFSRVFIKGWAVGKLTSCGDDHLEKRFSYKEVLFKKFFPPVKTIYPPAENVNETPALGYESDATSRQ